MGTVRVSDRCMTHLVFTTSIVVRHYAATAGAIIDLDQTPIVVVPHPLAVKT